MRIVKAFAKHIGLWGCIYFLLIAIPGVYGSADTAGIASASVMMESSLPPFTTQLFGLSILSLAPFAIVLFSSYIKTSIVLSLLRNAIGVQQSPPNQVLNGLSIIIAIYVMYPTLMEMYNIVQTMPEAPPGITSPQSHAYIVKAASLTKEPIRNFLINNTSTHHSHVFHELAKEAFNNTQLHENSFIVILPAFILTQIKEAFIMGTLIYLPFFIVDVVVSNILLALGMMMMSPLAIALPIKLGVMVMTNGWTSVVTSIIKSFHFTG